MLKTYFLSRKFEPDPRHGEGGFILLEVLVAMSMVATSWIAVMDVYSQLALRLGALEQKRLSIKRELDEYEIKLYQTQTINQVRTSPTINHQDLIHEASRMSHRSNPLPHASRGTIKK